MNTKERQATATERGVKQTPTSVAAAALGVPEPTLGVLRRNLARPEQQSLGLLLADRLVDEPDRVLAGASGHGPPVRTVVPAAHGERLCFESALLLVPAGVVTDHDVVLRLQAKPASWDFSVEALAPADRLTRLAASFGAWVEHSIGPGSPLRGSSFRVFSGQGGLALADWSPGRAVRDDLVLPEEVWRVVDRHVVGAIELAPVLATEGLSASTGLLCVGPPGTGKSQLARTVAAELGHRATVLVPQAGCARHAMRAVLRLAARLSPALVIVDDIDLVVGSRAGGGESEVLQEFLSSMDETMAQSEGVVVLASTNDPRSIDPAAIRATRFDAVIEMTAPGREARERVLRRHLSRFPDLDYGRLAGATDGATGADLRDLARRAYLESGGAVTTEAVLTAAADGRWARELVTGAYL